MVVCHWLCHCLSRLAVVFQQRLSCDQCSVALASPVPHTANPTQGALAKAVPHTLQANRLWRLDQLANFLVTLSLKTALTLSTLC